MEQGDLFVVRAAVNTVLLDPQSLQDILVYVVDGKLGQKYLV